MLTERDNLPIGIALVFARESKLHHHDYTKEWYIVTNENPRGLVYLDDKRISLKQDDVVYIAPETKHKIEASGSEYLKIYVITCPPWNEKDHHLDE